MWTLLSSNETWVWLAAGLLAALLLSSSLFSVGKSRFAAFTVLGLGWAVFWQLQMRPAVIKQTAGMPTVVEEHPASKVHISAIDVENVFKARQIDTQTYLVTSDVLTIQDTTGSKITQRFFCTAIYGFKLPNNSLNDLFIGVEQQGSRQVITLREPAYSRLSVQIEPRELTTCVMSAKEAQRLWGEMLMSKARAIFIGTLDDTENIKAARSSFHSLIESFALQSFPGTEIVWQ